jgi:hypothetical protein
MLKVNIVDPRDGKRSLIEDSAQLVTMYPSPPLLPQKSKIFRQYLTDDGISTGSNDMGIDVGSTGTDGACADHTTPFVFTSASGGLDDAKFIRITDTGAGGKGIIGTYTVSTVTDTNTVELTADPTDGTNETNMDWEIAPIDFWLPSHEDNDRYITRLDILVGYSTTGQMNEFADAAALANGFRFFYIDSKKAEVDIHDALINNSEILRLAGQSVLATGFEHRHLGSMNDYGYLLSINFSDMIPPYGVKLDRGSSEKIVMIVRDDATAATTMNCICYGFERFE